MANKPSAVSYKQLQKHLYKIEDELSFYHDMMNYIPGHIYWLDQNNVYQGCNQEHAKNIGLINRLDIIGKTNYDMPWKDIAESVNQTNNKVMQSGKPVTTKETGMVNGVESTFLSHKVPLKNKHNDTVGILGVSIDITEIERLQDSLVEEKKNAEAANIAKSEFLRNMEHQLRTPFSGVYSMVEFLSLDETDSKKKELLEITYQSAKEFLELLNDIIDFSRNQTESTIVLDKKFDLQELIKKAITMQKAAATAKHLKLIQKYPANIPSIWISDPKRIQRIILNLLSNAIKFSSKGTITVKVKLAKNIDEKRSIIQILVTDMGIGIPADKQELIYEKFYRVSPANHNKYTGAGLGLHVAKELLNDLEGEIEVKSTVNKGTTFTCTIPLKRPLIDDLSK